MDIKKTLLWVVFSVSGIMLFNNWQISHGNQPLALFAPPQGKTAEAPEKQAQIDSAQLPPVIDSTKAKSNVPINLPNQINETIKTKQIHLTNDVVDLLIDTKGGTVLGATMLKHLEGGKPFEMFANNATHKYFARSGLIATGIELPNHNDIFQDQLSADGQTLTLVKEKNGVVFEKTFHLSPGSYVIATQNKVVNKTNAILKPVLYTELIRDGIKIHESQFYSTFTGPATYTEEEKFNKVEFSDIEKQKVTIPKNLGPGGPGWVSMVQHYFTSAWIPENTNSREFYFDKLETNLYRAGMKSELGEIEKNGTKIEQAKLFIGPQEEQMLKTVAPGFELVKDYGHLTIIAKPIFWLLTNIYDFVGNWGWAIVLLTVLIKLAFFPLSAASYKSMARMKDVQPRLVQMKEQYKGDPQKLNVAMMEMYKKEKINPLGGCLPVVIQIPVFISLYWVLLSSVEMRGAPWIGWIHDLSEPDMFFNDLIGFKTIFGYSVIVGILPIIMAVSMYIQTKLNPTPPDPVQAKVMMLMPLVFSVMFFFFPSGLVLYWVVNNILSIAQQWQINKLFGASKKA